ncbi:MAG: rod shape-determining protein MreD [Turicibacter sp.]|nr:rod shape-determining protein MreD [Turicibacter sp.]
MVRVACLGVLILINFVFQTTVLVRFSILGVSPDTAVVFIVCYGILRGDVEGAIFGFFVGLMHDVFGADFVGIHAMFGLLAGYVAGKPFKDYFKDNYVLPFSIVVGVVFVYQIMMFFVAFLFRGQLDFLFYFRTIVLPKTIYTALFSLPLYGMLFILNAKLESYEDDRRNFFK